MDSKDIDSEKNIKEIIGEQKTEFNSKDEHFTYIFSQLNDDERKLFKQLNDKNIESLDNAFAEAGYSRYEQSDSYEKLKKSMPDDSVKKVEALYKTHIYSGSSNAPKNQIDMDEFRGITNKQDKTKESTVNEPKKFSIDVVKNIDTKLKEGDKDNPDKKRKQELSR